MGIYEESNGTVFAMSASGSVTVLADFDPTNGYPTGPLMEAADGSFYGVRGALVFRFTTNGDLSTVTSFPDNGSPDRPYAPNGPLAQGTDGNFYGTSKYGGTKNDGTVFKLTPAGELTTLATFYDTNGVFPTAGLVLGNDGSFYGTTSGQTLGGVNATIFKITPEGALTTLATLDVTNDSADTPGLVPGSDGNFYGTTSYGGIEVGATNGTVFKVTPTGTLTILSRFTNGIGFMPGQTGLAQGPDGNLYGTTEPTYDFDYTTVFQMTPKGVITSVVILPAGLAPSAGPIVGNDGKLYIAYNGYIYVLVPPPALQAMTKEGGNTTSSWTAAIGQKYQAQYTTNSSLATWLPLGSPLTATNLTITILDSPGPDAQRFYRVQLLP